MLLLSSTMCAALCLVGVDRLEPAHVLGEGDLGRQALHAGGAEEPDDAQYVLDRTRATQSSSVRAVRAPMLPLVVSPMCGTSTSAPARVIASADATSNTYGAVSSPRSAAKPIISTSFA